MDANAFTTPFQLTKRMHRALYPAIDPQNPSLSAAGKVVLITGATGGIGGEVARAWATAGARAIVLVGRNPQLLSEPAEAIEALSPFTQVLQHAADLTSEEDVTALFTRAVAAFTTIDVVVHAAATSASGPAGALPPTAWFAPFEANVKASYLLAHHYLAAVPRGGTFIFLGTLGAGLTVPGMSAYAASKLAVLKLAEALDAEVPALRVFTVHPGIVGTTATGRGMVVGGFEPFAVDKGVQTGGLSLYLAQERAEYLRGGFVSVNWDVEEMEQHKEEIVGKKLLKLGFLGAKLGPEGHPWSVELGL